MHDSITIAAMRKKWAARMQRDYLILPLMMLPWILLLAGGYLAYNTVSNLKKWAGAPVRLETVDGKLTEDQIKALSDARIRTLDDAEFKARIDELKWTLTAIGTLAGFVAIAQGATAFFSALAFTRQAQAELANITQIHEAVSQRYSLFSSIEEMRTRALADLAWDIAQTSSSSPDPTEVMEKDFAELLYFRMNIVKRQRLLSVESFASIDLGAGPDGDTGHHQDLRRLAFFYQSKFKYEQNAGAGSFADLERAEGYLRLAARKSGGDFTHLERPQLCLLDGSRRVHQEPDSLQRTEGALSERSRDRGKRERGERIEPAEGLLYQSLEPLEAKRVCAGMQGIEDCCA